MSTAKDAVTQAVDGIADELEALSRRIHDHPELGYQEKQAAGWLTGFLAAKGFKVESGVAGVETAFRATIETGDGPTIAILCEYDALPGIGHACGHNVIAASGAGAGAALALSKSLLPKGRVQVIGTPAEEGGGGKNRLDLFAANMTAVGLAEGPAVLDRLGSSDVGNVSQVIPTIQPMIGIAPLGTAIHTREFADAAVTPLARAGLLAAAKTMALTTFDLLADPARVRAAKDEFARSR